MRIGGGTGKYQGNGLGLTICRSIVGLHRGSIRANAGANGRGLSIIIDLPAPDASVERTHAS